MDTGNLLSLFAFLAVTSFGLLVLLLATGRKKRVDYRLAELSGKAIRNTEMDPFSQFTRQALPRMATPLLPKDDQERTRLQARLINAGYYSRQALYIFLGVKMLLILGSFFLGLAAGLTRLVPLTTGLFIGVLFGIFGLVVPSFWLDHKKKKRQVLLRRSLPDALDVLIICLEGGLSLPSALRRVSTELRTAHPELSREMNIAQREVQLGWTSGESLRRFGDRSDLEEVRTLSSVITQAERYGASLVKALRVHAETLRIKRMQRAEEMAQKAAVKILFPTLLFIFPGIFIVILGPALIQIYDMFVNKLPR